MKPFDNQRIIVVGMGRSGIACARFLNDRGGRVIVTDSADSRTMDEAAAELQGRGVRVELGGHPAPLFESADMVVVSPGVPHSLTPIAQAAERGVPVMGEIELASRFIEEPIIAVTGTNGKTTTTTLLGEMIQQSGLSVFVGGNIGTPLIEYAAKGLKRDRVVVEISSFQLDTMVCFRPQVGVLLNITPDHLDRYDDFSAYARSKGRLFENQTGEDVAVLNGSDPAVLKLCEPIAARKWFFNPPTPAHDGVFSEEGRVTARIFGQQDVLLDLSSSRLTGRHNVENVAAAALATLAAGGSVTGIESALKNFEGLAHRLMPVCTVAGVRYFDDSKATNTDAVLRALEAFDRPVVLIMGGRDKGGGYETLRDAVRKGVKGLIVIGEAQDVIARELEDCCSLVSKVSSMEAAVLQAYRWAKSGDVVLLSPACASFDMYTSYAHRGDVFCRAVARLAERR